MKTAFLILLTILTLTKCDNHTSVKENKFDFACKDSVNIDSVEYIVFGSYCGMCDKNFTDMFRLENQKLLEDTTDFFYYKKPDNSFNVLLSDKKYSDAEKLKSLIPCYLLNKETDTFGSPDSYDQGGLYLEFKYMGKTKIFHLDNYIKSNPIEIQLFAQQLKDIIADTNNKE